MADREADAYLRLLAEIMGVEDTTDPQATRDAIERELGVAKLPGPLGDMADALGISSTGHHPTGRASTVDELVLRYLSGELKDSYDLPEPGTPPSVMWFDADDKASYETEDGFHPRADSYEFTKLWYQIVGEELDFAACGSWHVAHGGLRWEYYGDATCGDLRSTVEAALSDSYARYCEVSEAIAVAPEPAVMAEELNTEVPTEPEWGAQDWESLLED